MTMTATEILRENQKRTRALFDSNLSATSQLAQENIVVDERSIRLKLRVKIKDENFQLEHLPKGFLQQLATTSGGYIGSNGTGAEGQEDLAVDHVPTTTTTTTTAASSSSSSIAAIVQEIATKSELDFLHQQQQQQQQLIHLPHVKAPVNTVIAAVPDPQGFSSSLVGGAGSSTFVDSTGARSLIRTRIQEKPKPEWHAPWKLMRVLSGHLGWVRCVAVDPSNEWFATGSADRVIKIWDMASGTLKLTLTGHISTVRGLAVSSRHPYLFSCGEDKMVKCWDLETNKVVRHYHGHLSGVFCMSLHPTLDILVTGGRDSVARVWDMRTRQEIHILQGHTDTIASVATQSTDPQIITGSMDSTVRLWDLAAGKTMTQLTHHKKSIRALALHPTELSFVSASPDNIKQWKLPEGRFMQNLSGHRAIINATSVNQDNVLFSGGDNGTMKFWDYKSGVCFQDTKTIPQSGSLDSECGIFASTFDYSGTRLITAEADKSIKIWREDPNATPETYPVAW